MKLRCSAVLITMAALLAAQRSWGDLYQVDRSFMQSVYYPYTTVTLTGTVGIPEGNYILTNSSPSPFTSVDLTLTINGMSYAVNNAINRIAGSGQFLITASPTALIFSASGDTTNYAVLNFNTGSIPPPNEAGYGIGADSFPANEVAGSYYYADTVNRLTFPVVFGVAVPEPSSLSILIIAAGFAGVRRFRART